MVEYLVKLGHRNIIYVTPGENVMAFIKDGVSHQFSQAVSRARYGYRMAMESNGLAEYVHVHYLPVDHPWDEADDRALLDVLRDRKPTACCCLGHPHAEQVFHVCREHRIRVPDELSVISCIGLSAAKSMRPTLTGMVIPTEEIGRTAARYLDTLIEELRLEGYGIHLPSALFEGKSTAPPKKG
jgi:DNA-binding LacI/PurR family transcriptional regulator